MTGTKLIRVGPRLLRKLELIIEQEKKRGRDKTSYVVSGEILSDRIDNAGGLKESNY